uniref:Tetratricopeptide TPR_4 n=1 Tax=Solibacter usitatus (strain Ellin6076) TaxID=234267 RepID=Q028H1_SOLUE
MSTLRILVYVVLLFAMVPALARSQDAEQLFRDGERLFAEHSFEAAIAAFQRSAELRPEYAPGWKALGVVYASRGDFDRAETPFRNACERQPSLPDACLYYGRTLYLLNRFQAAIPVLQRTLQREPRNAEGYRLLALSLEGLGRAAEAGDAFRQSLNLNRRSSPDEDPGIDYGVFLTRQGHPEQAIGPLEDALKRHPDSARGHLELGCTLLELDRLAEAADQLEKSIALDPRAPRAHLLLGKVYLRLGRTEAAEEHLRQGSRTVK